MNDSNRPEVQAVPDANESNAASAIMPLPVDKTTQAVNALSTNAGNASQSTGLLPSVSVMPPVDQLGASTSRFTRTHYSLADGTPEAQEDDIMDIQMDEQDEDSFHLLARPSRKGKALKRLTNTFETDVYDILKGNRNFKI